MDSLLALLLSVAIPTVLALLGATLTIKTLDTHKRERWTWLAVFCVLAVIAVVLGFVQQVRTTAAQTKSQVLAQADRQHLMEPQRYTQGQLDSITTVLTSVVNAGKGSDTYQAAMKGLLAALPTQTQKPAAIRATSRILLNAKALSNTELKYKTLEEVGKMRDIEHQAFFATSQTVSEETTERAFRISHDSWEDIRQDCLVIRDELVLRLPPSVTTLKSPVKEEMESTLTEGNFLWGLEPIAEYFEKMAEALPKSGTRTPAK